MTTSIALLILFGLTLLITLLGFWKLTYFVSIGYAFSVVAMAVAAPLLFPEHLGKFALLQIILLIGWGLRLGIFLVIRERQSSFRKQAVSINDQYSGVNLLRKFLIWAGVSVLYVAMVAPALFHAQGYLATSHTRFLIADAIGAGVMAAGLLIETLADAQKSAFKAENPSAFCNVGLYAWVRCPNYLGEILFWAGSWAMGIPFYTSPVRWGISLAGVVILILIMFGSTRRLEGAQERRYGHIPEYQAHIRRVPVLFPFVPLYSLKNVKVYLE